MRVKLPSVCEVEGAMRVDDGFSLVGRADDLAAIAASADGGALLLTGAPGVGKTALLDAAAATPGTRVLRAAGVQFEADISFAALNQLLLPLAGEFGALPGPVRSALEGALGLASPAAVDRLLVSTAVLTLLRLAAAERPVLLVVDDLPWVDRASAVVLGFVARRLAGTGVRLIAASRTGEASFFEHSGIPAREIRPLTADAARVLLDSRHPGLPPEVRRRVLAEAQGNPLALGELAAGGSLQEMFARRIAELPAATRRLLLIAALEGTGDLRVLRVAGEVPDLAALAPAEQARLVAVAGRARFLHPLTRAAVVELAAPAERRAAHRALAATVDSPERKAWHLADAAEGADEDTAVLLEAAGQQTLGRGDSTGAIAALLKAAELSADEDARRRRLAAVAYLGVNIAGSSVDVTQLDHGELYAAVATAYLLLARDGTVETAYRLLTGILETQDPGSGAVQGLVEVLNTLLLVCWFAGRPEWWEPFYAAIDRWRDDIPADLVLLAGAYADPARITSGVLAEIDAEVAALDGGTDPFRVLKVASACLYTDRLGGCRAGLRRVYEACVTGGAIVVAVTALAHLCMEHIMSGRWAEAGQLGAEGAELCATNDIPLQAWTVRHRRAVLATLRGDHDTAAVLVAEMVGWGRPRGMRQCDIAAHHVGTLGALGREDFEAAFGHASAISAPGEFASHVAYALWVPLDLVESAVRTGRTAEARAHVDAMMRARLGRVSPRLALLTAASRALVDGDSTSFDEALATPGAAAWPFDLARVRLLAGENARHTARGRQELLHALDVFEQLGAKDWAARASAGLRAGGNPVTGRRTVPLTDHELEIARLAAAGLTNKQIAGRLDLSPRTVSAHLYRIFPKLGVATRAALGDALAEPDLP